MAEEKKTVKKASAKKAEAAPKAEKKASTKKAPKAEKKAEAVVEEKKEAPKRAEKKEEVKAEPVVEKPAVSEAHASSLNVRVTPRKVRLVIELVRGKDVDEALAILKNVNRAASTPVAKLIQSAAANATNNFGLDKEKLYVAEIQASDGVKMKRFMPRGKGSSSPLIKRTANIYCTVKERN